MNSDCLYLIADKINDPIESIKFLETVKTPIPKKYYKKLYNKVMTQLKDKLVLHDLYMETNIFRGEYYYEIIIPKNIFNNSYNYEWRICKKLKSFAQNVLLDLENETGEEFDFTDYLEELLDKTDTTSWIWEDDEWEYEYNYGRVIDEYKSIFCSYFNILEDDIEF